MMSHKVSLGWVLIHSRNLTISGKMGVYVTEQWRLQTEIRLFPWQLVCRGKKVFYCMCSCRGISQSCLWCYFSCESVVNHWALQSVPQTWNCALMLGGFFFLWRWSSDLVMRSWSVRLFRYFSDLTFSKCYKEKKKESQYSGSKV